MLLRAAQVRVFSPANEKPAQATNHGPSFESSIEILLERRVHYLQLVPIQHSHRGSHGMLEMIRMPVRENDLRVTKRELVGFVLRARSLLGEGLDCFHELVLLLHGHLSGEQDEFL